MGQNQDAVGMGVIHVFVGHAGMKKRFDRWVRRPAVDTMDSQLILHLFVGKRFDGKEPSKRREVQPRKSFGLDGRKVPPASFDEDDLSFFTRHILEPCLYGRVPPAMENQAGVASDKTRCVNAHREIFWKGGVFRNNGPGICLVVKALCGFSAIFPFHLRRCPLPPAPWHYRG